MGYNKKYDTYRPTDKVWTDKMAQWKKGNREKAKKSQAENWMREKLKELRKIGIRFRRQSIRGTRIYDFWCADRGIAVEVDGGYHETDWKKEKDNKYDFYNQDRSGIKVLRIKNFDEHQAKKAIHIIKGTNLWLERRYFMGIITEDHYISKLKNMREDELSYKVSKRNNKKKNKPKIAHIPNSAQKKKPITQEELGGFGSYLDAMIKK